MSQCDIHLVGLDPSRPVNLFSYAALTATNDPRHFRVPENRAYGRELVKRFREFWNVTSFENSALLVYAHPYTDCAQVRVLVEQAKAAGKPLVFLETSENEPPSSIEHGRLYRQSIFGVKRRAKEHACASMHSDLLLERGLDKVPLLVKSETPRIGFCGYVGTRAAAALFRALGQKQKADGLQARQRAVSAFRGNHAIETRFLCRHRYLGNASLAFLDNKEDLQQQRCEFVDNILECPYGLAVRGKGNHSVRFYELLSAGRIPVFINTDCVLPFEDRIDYKKHVVWVEFEQVQEVGSRLNRFHNSISREAFGQMQLDNRRLWEEWLSPLGFHRKAVVPFI